MKSKDSFLVKNNYDIIEIIHESIWKKTRVLKLQKRENFYIAKSISKDSPTHIRNKFFNEVNYYKNHQYSYLPKYIQSSESILIIEFIEGKALRDILKNDVFNKETFELLATNIESLYNNSKLEINEINDFNNAFTHLSNLLQSGPIQTKNYKISSYKLVSNKLILLLLKLKLKWYLSKISLQELKSGFVHGDLHYNNIIIDAKGDIKFIDFENIRYDGFFDFDVMYLYAMLEINIPKDREESKLIV